MFVGRIVALVIIAASISFKSKAQSKVKIGIHLGPSLSSIDYTPEPNHNGTIKPNYRIGYLTGIDAKINIWERLEIQVQPRFLKSNYGTVESSVTNEANGLTYNTYINNYSLNKLDLPINIIYNITNTTHGLYILFGPEIGILLSGRRNYNSNFSNANAATEISGEDEIVVKDTYQLNDNRYYMKRWDFGIQAGIGYQYNRLAVQSSYRVGLINVAANSSYQLPSPKIYSRLAEVQVSYYFTK